MGTQHSPQNTCYQREREEERVREHPGGGVATAPAGAGQTAKTRRADATPTLSISEHCQPFDWGVYESYSTYF